MTRRGPGLLIAFRAACAPAIVVLAGLGFGGRVLAAVLVAALVSDIFDGIIARRLGIDTVALRHADTIVDTMFYAAAGAALWMAVPQAFAGSAVAIAAWIVLHVSRTTFEIAKYGRVAAYHMWSSKLLGMALAAGLGVGFATGRPTAILTWALRFGSVNELEGLAASVVLPAWSVDLPSFAHAWRRRA